MTTTTRLLCNDEWTYLRQISGWTNALYCIYRGVTLKHLVGWAGTVDEAKQLAQDYHDAKFCGRRDYTYYINKYQFPFVMSQLPREHQNCYNTLESYVAKPVPKHTPLVFERSKTPVYFSISVSC